MIRNALVDTGALIALIDRQDQHHAWVRSQFAKITPPVQTCEAVLTEACFLARRMHGGVAAVMELFERSSCELSFGLRSHFREVSNLMERYSNVPMSLADACLVRMSEIVSQCVVVTLDRDFHVYRRNKRQRIPLLIPPTL